MLLNRLDASCFLYVVVHTIGQCFILTWLIEKFRPLIPTIWKVVSGERYSFSIKVFYIWICNALIKHVVVLTYFCSVYYTNLNQGHMAKMYLISVHVFYVKNK